MNAARWFRVVAGAVAVALLTAVAATPAQADSYVPV